MMLVQNYAGEAKEENIAVKGSKLKELGWKAYYEQMQKVK